MQLKQELEKEIGNRSQATPEEFHSAYLDKESGKEELGHSHPYYERLFLSFYKQLVDKLDFSRRNDDKNAPQAEFESLVYERAESLTRHFIKRKVGAVQEPAPFDSHSGLFFDPHFHLNSIYVQEHPEFLLLLPAYDKIYNLLTDASKSAEPEKRLLNDGIIRDVQYFNNHPQSTENQSGDVVVNETSGYHRGGNLVSKNIYNDSHHHSSDYCGHEFRTNESDLSKYIELMIKKGMETIRFHMGETLLPIDGKESVELLLRLIDQYADALQGKTLRIGHGTHMGIDSMIQCAQKQLFVESCLSSNKETGVVAKRHEYPLGLMLLLDVPVVLGTDGGDMYYTSLAKEYAYAKKVLAKFIEKITQKLPEPVALANGEVLTCRYIKSLDTMQVLANMQDDDVVSFADLAKLKGLEDRLNMGRLINNMNQLAYKMTGNQAFTIQVNEKDYIEPSLQNLGTANTTTTTTTMSSVGFFPNSLVKDSNSKSKLVCSYSYEAEGMAIHFPSVDVAAARYKKLPDACKAYCSLRGSEIILRHANPSRQQGAYIARNGEIGLSFDNSAVRDRFADLVGIEAKDGAVYLNSKPHDPKAADQSHKIFIVDTKFFQNSSATKCIAELTCYRRKIEATPSAQAEVKAINSMIYRLLGDASVQFSWQEVRAFNKPGSPLQKIIQHSAAAKEALANNEGDKYSMQ
ncbi:adenosine deaminase [Legionella massiliensis]|uniref:Adenosine deaminase n=1 Tax=Legionella massiliensis TaxID=1034943 RepID=A0A078L5C7_9GAMM|nr:hypothetical protein [Legionella massiliensis]CDZ79133.1 adenosine deaminase [Legionella massiliensis]CEE14871.1 Aminodeoxyfutalosine deaminase [Legionella massiliensis]